MKTLVISKWYGRLGNNIFQVHNCIRIALTENCNIKIPPHPYFNTEDIIIDCTNINTNYEYGIFFKFNPTLYPNNIEKSLVLLRSIFRKPIDFPSLQDNEIVMHVRSGDIFSRKPHESYLQPPLSYYEKCMKGYDIVHIIAEDTKNPIINELLRKYPTIKFKVQTLNEDIALILRSKNVVASFGTFIPALLIMSINIKKLYTFDYIAGCGYFGNYEQDITDLSDYKQKMGAWINSEDQRRQMLEA